MMPRVAWRSLATRPVRAAVLMAGFGFGVAVMIDLLGVGHVMIEQAQSPALAGGGDLVLTSLYGSIDSARFMLSSVLRTGDVGSRVTARSPSRESRVFLMTGRGPLAITAHGGIPSAEHQLPDPETGLISNWRDAPGDMAWATPEAADILRAMDRFHPVPATASATDASSWAEWLYFNGQTADGALRIYVTFLVGGPAGDGRRTAGVRLQLERNGKFTTYSARDAVDEVALISSAPNLIIGSNRVALERMSYRIQLDLKEEGGTGRAAGEIVLDARPGRSLPPASIHGAKGWASGYVVPVLSGTMHGSLAVGGERVEFTGAGYHDHNWGFWRGVTWQWGQVAHDDLSIVYGRVFPPPDVADPKRVPGFMVVLGPDGPLGFSTDVTIDDRESGHVEVRGAGRVLDLALHFDAEHATASISSVASADTAVRFVQMDGRFRVEGTVAGRALSFTARGAAETFRH